MELQTAGINGYVFADAIRVDRVTTPEITVHEDGNQLEDGVSSVDFGVATVGDAVTKTFEIRNNGVDDLVVGDALTLPLGFSLGATTPVSLFGGSDTTLAPGELATFDVVFTPASVASFGGQLSMVREEDSSLEALDEFFTELEDEEKFAD